MSRFPQSARHPDVSSLIDKWSVIRDSINVTEDSTLSEFPNLAVSEGRVRGVTDIEYFGAAREVMGANAFRALAKCYEALDGSAKCGEKGVTVAALVQAYNASFFAARGFCMLMGFAPLNRSSVVTLDAFSEETTKARRTEDVLRLHRYKRWGHEEVWILTKRLVDTIKVPRELENTKDWLRKAKIQESSQLRNAFQYDDSTLGHSDIRSFVDFPGCNKCNLFATDVPIEMRKNYLITKSLMEICSHIVSEVRMENLLSTCVSNKRLMKSLDWGKWA